MQWLGLLSLTLLPLVYLRAGEEPPFIRGDADMSGVVEVTDGIQIGQYLMALPHGIRHFDAADVNDDGFLTFEDLLHLLRFLVVGEPKIPDPYPNPGSDPTPDTITHDRVEPPPAALPDRDYKVWLYWATSPRSADPTAILRMCVSYFGDNAVLPATDAHGAIRFDPEAMKFLSVTSLFPDAWEAVAVDFGKAISQVEKEGEVGISVIQKDPVPDPLHLPEWVDIAELKFTREPDVALRKPLRLDYYVGGSNLFYYTGVGVFTPATPVVPVASGSRFIVSLRDTSSRFIRGDSNGDGRIDLADVIYSLASLFLNGRIPPCLDAADANDDGNFDISDPLYTIQWLFLGGEPPPPPFGPIPEACGLDPTDDNLTCEFYGPCYENPPIGSEGT